MKIEYTAYNTIDARISQASAVLQSVMESPELQPHHCSALWAADELLQLALNALEGHSGRISEGGYY